MRREPHPISGAIYQDLGDGHVRVTNEADGSYGLFDFKGGWLEGEITQADPLLLNYVGGPALPDNYDVFWMMTPPETFDGTQELHAPYGAQDEWPRTIAKYQGDPGLETEAGTRSAGHISLDFFLKNDRRPELVPEVYALTSPMPGGPMRVSTERYLTKEFHDREVEHIWKKTWQMACRVDDIPNVGDHYVYEIAHLSFLIVRTAEHEIKAHVNACLHRGRILKDCSGKGAKELRCPFHGWTWRLDGSLKDITAEWDFPGVRETVAQLPAAKIATWAGFVFINPDVEAGPLEEFLGEEMMAHYTSFKFEQRYKQAHVQRMVRANWKIVMEAFMEAYHVITTHPQQMAIAGDLANSNYDVFGNWGRAGHLSGTYQGSPMRGIIVPPEQALTVYRMGADANREFLRGILGDEADQFSDAELNDTGSFNDLFPNIHPWGGWARIVFRFRPNGDNHEECIFDVMLLSPWPEGKPKPAPAKLHLLGPDESWANAPELFSLSKIIDQDCFNAPKVQQGLKAKQQPYVWLSSYQEGKVRNFHKNYDRALGISDEPPPV